MKKRLNKVLSLAIAIIMISGVICSFTLNANATMYTVSIHVTNDQTEARRMLDMVNDFRTGENAWYWNETDTEKVKVNNLGLLKYDYALEKIAMQRAAEIALYWAHQRPNGTMCYTCTYNGNRTYGENIAIGYNMMYKSEDAYMAWREDNDPYAGQGHRRNMLEEFESIGIAHAVYGNVQCWVQEFSWFEPTHPETEADDSEADVDIEIDSEYISDVNANTTIDEINLNAGESKDLPGVNTSIFITENWPGLYYCNVVPKDISWTIEDKSIAKIHDNKVMGLTEGSTNLKTNILGEDISVPVNVTGSLTLNSIKKAQITLDKEKYVYTGEAIVPQITVTFGENELKKDQDYEVAIKDNTDIGIATITITGIGDYTDSLDKEFEIYCAHNGETYIEEKDPHDATCEDDGYYIKETHCKICKDVLSREKIIISKAQGHNYEIESIEKATLDKDGKINKKCTKCDGTLEETIYHPKTYTLSKTSFTYNGKVQKPSVTVKDTKGAIIAKPNYDLTYSKGCTNVGEYKVTIKFKGNYSGSKSLTFKINPKGTSLSSLTAGSKKFTAKWKKQIAQTTGYEVMYSTSSKFSSGNKTANIGSNKTTSKTVKSLKAKKKYYVKIRTYKKIGTKKYYSSWSASKSVKTK